MNSFLHHKFYTMHQTGHKTVVTIMYAGAIERRTKHDDILKLSRRNGQHVQNSLLCPTITKEFSSINLKLC